jgi:peptidoglycan/xylan/chitin deacetylase (PgdA/CDA1 family)/ketosteroid isomerase-like protein
MALVIGLLTVLAGGPSLAREETSRAETLVNAGADSRPLNQQRPLLVTLDDLPISSRRLHPEAAERKRITDGLLAVLKKHGVPAVGLVTWQNVAGPDDESLLAAWLAAGHELGNHSATHPNLSAVSADAYIADVEAGRTKLAAFLQPRGRSVRFYRYTFLREGDTQEKYDAVRAYLTRSGQRDLPVTLDTQDWSFEQPWVEARRRGDPAALARIGQDFQASLRLSVTDQEARGDRLLGRQTPQILLLHATEVCAAQLDALLAWLEGTGHRFAAVDEVLADPAFAASPDFIAPYGCGLWDRLAAVREEQKARESVIRLLEDQAVAWNRGDLETFCSVYADDAAFVTPKGLTRGRAEVLHRYRASYPDTAAMGQLSFEFLEVRPVRGREVSLLGDARPGRIHGVTLIARWMLTAADGTARSGLTLLVLHRAGDTWRIVQDASM